MVLVIVKHLFLMFAWISQVDGMFKLPGMFQMAGLKKSEIVPGTLVLFQQNRIQGSSDKEQRAEKLNMELARIMDPPFNSDRSRVNIEKVTDPAVNVGVKPKHMMLAKSMFDDELASTSSSNQTLKLEIFKIPNNLCFAESMGRQIAMEKRTEIYDAMFLTFDLLRRDIVDIALEETQHKEVTVLVDAQITGNGIPESPEHLIGFLEKILKPSHLDNNTLDAFRDLVAHYVFSYYLHSGARPAEYFENYVHWFDSGRIDIRHPKSCNILRIFYRNLQRHKPSECPKMELMRDEYVDFAMVWDMLSIIQFRFIEFEVRFTRAALPNLYRLMGSDAHKTFALWDKARDRWTESTDWIAFTAELVSRKMGLQQRIEGLSNAVLIRKVHDIILRMRRIWYNSLRADKFNRYWKNLYELKQSGFSGRIAIVNRDYILIDSWIQSLLQIFGRNNTVIERVDNL